MSSLLLLRAARSLSAHPSTPVFAQLLLERQVAPAGMFGLFPVASCPSLRSTENIPESFPLNVLAPELPDPFDPAPVFVFAFPKPICQKTAEMLETIPFGSTT